MSEYTIENKETPTTMVRRSPDGGLVETEMKREDYIVPPTGEFRLRVTGFAKPFEMTSEQYGTSTNTRLEFEIVSEKGKGKRWTDLYGWTVGPKSRLGKLIRRACSVEIPKGALDVAELILPVPPIEFIASVGNSEDTDDQGRPKYAKVAIDTVRPVDGSTAAYDPFAA